MAGNVTFSPEAVQAAIGNYKSRMGEFQSIVDAIKGTMFDLQGTWTGAAEQTYETQVRALLKNLETITQSLEGATGKLQTAISAYEATEAAQQSAISGVNSDAGSVKIE